MTKTSTAQIAYHRHTGRPLGLVTSFDGDKGYRGTTGLGTFVVAKRDAVLRPATDAQVQRFSAIQA